ncbi:MAG TPA: hypothetical protein PLS95_16800 [Thermoanaerobaculales bacterium]|nr:hypothetical protein [Thermoanaerobaculales bacterium]
MGDGGERLGLAAQAGDTLQRADRRQRLDRHPAAEDEVERLVDDAGAAPADPPFELEAPGNRLGDDARIQRGATAPAEAVLGGVDPAAVALLAERHLVDAGGRFRARLVGGALLGDLRLDGLGHPHEGLGDLLTPDAVPQAFVHGPPQVTIRCGGPFLLSLGVVLEGHTSLGSWSLNKTSRMLRVASAVVHT